VAPDRIPFRWNVEVGERIAEDILKRLRLSNDEMTQCCACRQSHAFADVVKMKDSTLNVFFRLRDLKSTLSCTA